MIVQHQVRKIGGTGWNIWRGVVGVAYLVAAAFNLLFTLPRGDLGWFAESAWVPFLQDIVRQVVVPNHELFMVLVVAFEVAVGALILSRDRYVDVGVGASVLWPQALLMLVYAVVGLTLATRAFKKELQA